MNVIQTIAAQRQKLLDGLDANQGDINLRIFEDFYPDEAHFIYELLQNAEDAGATEVLFELRPDSCSFEHNGTRHFNEQDIRGITGIFNSSKAGSPDKIGKFGVGFKSVFVYTDSPVIYSRDFSFRILNLVLPQSVASRPDLGERTRFEFPFNNPKKTAEAAYAEVEAGLQQLCETTLLFLSNLHYIRWKVGEQEGAVLREEHSETHIEILKQAHGMEVASSHWLRITAPVKHIEKFSAAAEGVERQKVAVAYELSLTGSSKAFDKSKPLSEQFKIAPAVKGTVSVFFPAEKESSGLRFHLHAPFVPELSRASIKNSPDNVPLFGQLAELTAKSLHSIKDLGLLSGEFLSVLPNSDDQLPDRYKCIRQSVLEEMRAYSLVPTFGGGFAPASRLFQARAALKAFLSSEDLSFVTGRNDRPEWAIGATQRNSNQDRFLSSLGIQSWDTEALKDFLERKARNEKSLWGGLEVDPAAIEWLKAKPFEWSQALYATLYRHCEEAGEYGHLSDVHFIKLTSGKLGTGRKTYFQAGPAALKDVLPRVDDRVLTVGSRKAQQEDARRFLEKLGVREPNELDELVVLLESQYAEEGDEPNEKQYLADLKRMIAFLERNPERRGIFQKAHIFKVDAPDFTWATPEHVFLDEPYAKTGLTVLHQSLDGTKRRWPLARWYAESGISLEKLLRFAGEVGCQKEFDGLHERVSCYPNNPNWKYLATAPGLKWGNGINRDFALTAVARALLHTKKLEASLLVWKALCRSESLQPSILQACYQVTEKGGPRFADSQVVCALRELAWVPQTDGSFVRPGAASTEKLPQGFAVDSGFRWLEVVGFNAEEKKQAAESTVRATKRAELGFESEEELQRAQAFIRLLSEEEQKRILSEARQHEPVELPERPLRNAERRQQRVAEEAKKTPVKESILRERSIQIGTAEAKVAAKVYLADQYTNSRGQMICQVCKDELPFKLLNGSYYFEAVELLADMPKRYREAYLALCPNHAAAFIYANGQRNAMLELVETAAGNEVEVFLGGEVTTIYFTATHLADVRACFSEEGEIS